MIEYDLNLIKVVCMSMKLKKIKVYFVGVACLILNPSLIAEETPNWNWSGDLRNRLQMDKIYSNQNINRSRYRTRLRVTSKVKINDTISVQTRFASGSDDPRSTNQTFGDYFDTKTINLDQAFVSIKKDNLTMHYGKMKNPIFTVSDLMWDSDITPEGIAFKYSYKSINLVSSYFILDELSTSENDPYLVSFQPQITTQFSDKINAKTSLNLYHINTQGDQNIGVNFNIVGLSSVISQKNIYKGLNAKVMIDAFQNISSDQDSMAYLIGLKLGHGKINKIGTWAFTTSYRYIEENSTLNTLPDSDAYNGNTNVKGFESILKLGINKQTNLAFDYYNMTNMTNNLNQQLFQCDLNIKF